MKPGIYLSFILLCCFSALVSCQQDNDVDNIDSTTTDSLVGNWTISRGYLIKYYPATNTYDSTDYSDEIEANAHAFFGADSTFNWYESATADISGKFYVTPSRVITVVHPTLSLMNWFIKSLGTNEANLYIRMAQSNATTVYYYHNVLTR